MDPLSTSPLTTPSAAAAATVVVLVVKTILLKTQPQEKHAESIADTSKYWGELASTKLDWFSPFTHVQNGSFADGSVSWFLNGKLNTCYNAVDRWCLNGDNGGGRANDVAITWEGDEPSATREITFAELLAQTSKIANALKSEGVKKGDVVTIYVSEK